MSLLDINLPGVGREVVLVGAVFAGENDSYFVTIPGKEDTPTPRQVSLTSDEWKTFLRQTDLMEVEVTVEDEHGKLKRAIIRKCERQVSRHISWVVFRRDGFACRYCGRDDGPLTVDHLITWESGGPTTEENLVACCGRCNNLRGETPLAEWFMSSVYKRVSARLTMQQKFANQALVGTLANIPICVIKEKKPGKKRRRR